jgi:hypothetical protein
MIKRFRRHQIEHFDEHYVKELTTRLKDFKR